MQDMLVATQEPNFAFETYAIWKKFGASADISLLLPEVLNELRTRLGIQRSALMLENGTGRLELHSSVGLSRMHLDRTCYTSSEGVVGKVFSSGMPIIIPDTENEKMFPKSDGDCPPVEFNETAAFVAVPIRSSSKVLGVLACDHSTDQTKLRGKDDLRLLSTVANFIGQQIELSARALAMSGRTKEQNCTENVANSIIGVSMPMQKILSVVRSVSPTRSFILLQGELGTGKGKLAEEIHKRSVHAHGAFIRVNCAMYTEAQLDEKLFGIEKKNFIGAGEERAGALELANGGTLFLDEIANMAPSIQTKLLHALRELEFRRLGGDRAITVEFRLICATCRDLEKLVVNGAFLADLYYQINVVSLLLPPLRDRREDIPALADRLIERYNAENTRSLNIAPQAMKILCGCTWPGNIRELGNCLEHAATMASGNVIETLPCASRGCLAQTLSQINVIGPGIATVTIKAPPSRRKTSSKHPRMSGGKTLSSKSPVNHRSRLSEKKDRQIVKREQLILALEQCGWVQTKAARQLNITLRQVNYAVQKYQVEIKKF